MRTSPLHGLLFDRDIIEHLDYYCDYVHHSAEAGSLVLEKIHDGTDRLTAENYREILAGWQDFVVNYDYEKFWDVELLDSVPHPGVLNALS